MLFVQTRSAVGGLDLYGSVNFTACVACTKIHAEMNCATDLHFYVKLIAQTIFKIKILCFGIAYIIVMHEYYTQHFLC